MLGEGVIRVGVHVGTRRGGGPEVEEGEGERREQRVCRGRAWGTC